MFGEGRGGREVRGEENKARGGGKVLSLLLDIY